MRTRLPNDAGVMRRLLHLATTGAGAGAGAGGGLPTGVGKCDVEEEEDAKENEWWWWEDTC